VFTQGEAPFVGGLQAMVGVAMIAGFSFQGTELIGIAAGESENPRKNVPIAIRQVFWRILMFYVLAIFVIGMLIPYTDPRLLQNDATDVSVSPFTLLFERAGLAFAASLMNAVILSAVLSAGTSGMYASTRMLHSLAEQGKAPRLFARVSRNGVPRNALLATTAVGALCFFTSLVGDKALYGWLLNTSGMCGFIAWLGIAVSHYRFRQGYLAQGRRLEDLPYRAKLFPFGPLLAFALCLVITLGQNYAALFGPHGVDWLGLAATYISLPLFLAVWLGYRFKHGSRLVKLKDMDVSPSGD
jgi:lysine-specific permease